MLLLDTNKISSAKTREYFKEVESSYINGNYRSAVVMLYVVTIFDILSKLQDYCNTYPDDEKVKSVLDSYTAHFSNRQKDEKQMRIFHRHSTDEFTI